MIELDGSFGEGGGQILRSALTLSLLTGKPFCIVRIRAGRKNPGLRPQHLAAVRAAAAVGRAEVRGDRLGSMELCFSPRGVSAGRYRFATGTAGAATLVFQTVLLPLALMGGEESELVLEGGTHVPQSPSFDDLDFAYRAWLLRLGVAFTLELERPGFYPRGGGRFRARVSPAGAVRPLAAEGSFAPTGVVVRGVAARLPFHVAKRIARRAAERLEEAGLLPAVEVRHPEAVAPGAYGFVGLSGRPGPVAFTALGAPGKPSERVGEEAALRALGFLRRGAPVEAHLADQLLLPLAVAPGPSAFRVERVTRHLETQAWLIPKFLPVRVRIAGERVELRPQS